MRRRKRQLSEANLPLLEHLKALRKVLIISAYAILLGTVIGWFFSDRAFAYLADPIIQLQEITFITTTPLEPMLVKVKVSMLIGVVLALPLVFWQIWSFVLPALKQNERKYLYLIFPSSVLLFLSGVGLCFFVVLPIGLKFLLFVGGDAVTSYTPLLTKTSYIGFLMTMFLTFGLVFQLPIVLLVLIRIGVLTPQMLAAKRRWAILTIVILAVVVSPTPDLLTQLLMAGPMYLLYEMSIWLGYLVARSREKELALK
ncbi:twin-arginine translocase subunit TatC [Desulfosporosinus nitroreducens]|uniref:Sec-independent protein translocase protein TatC n=1 Tax=Desulfosporosinus nitroreducens TaxID=2018668 RepID=A0ABT8QTM9_9FIRM|nr:twin-arginine translocase subunit TatC [Desulfosporosinus nitroreducens]MCO1601859.1 twin-arginine translocase subunit TatC [Desulfosporosinus nitroreducens]MDO0823413.1 twin-arginine translocase subunit TatC [Desulfosporosinus nitroreducens]